MTHIGFLDENFILRDSLIDEGVLLIRSPLTYKYGRGYGWLVDARLKSFSSLFSTGDWLRISLNLVWI